MQEVVTVNNLCRMCRQRAYTSSDGVCDICKQKTLHRYILSDGTYVLQDEVKTLCPCCTSIKEILFSESNVVEKLDKIKELF